MDDEFNGFSDDDFSFDETNSRMDEQSNDSFRADEDAQEEYNMDEEPSIEEEKEEESPFIKILNIVIVALVIIACGLLSYLAYLFIADRLDNDTDSQPGQAINSWERIQETGKILVSTSIDYPPFEYYDKEYRVTGFDIALIHEIANRWGVTADIRDTAFDSIGNSVQLGNSDLAISALSITDERKSKVDFTNVYYVGEDGILAKNDSPIQSITNIRELALYTIGVQRGSVYADFVRQDLIASGLMPESNLFEYVEAGHAVRDLAENRVQVVLLDLKPAQAAVAQAPVKLVGQGINQQRFAIAVQKGQPDLLNQLNATITDMQNDGTLNQLAQEYLDLAELLPPDPPVTPDPTATPNPAVTPEPEPCINDATFVQDLNHDDQNLTNLPEMSPGQQFQKGWRIRNSGTCVWDNTYRLDYDSGNSPAARMNGTPVIVQGIVQPGQTYDFLNDFIAPLQPGEYVGYWHMVDGKSNQAFGSRVWVAVEVIAPATPTPMPTSTPTTGISFSADRTTINAGECVNFTWSVTNASAVYFYSLGQNWWEYQVPLEGSKVECPPATATFELRVVKRDGSVVVQQIAIHVIPNPEAPVIHHFSVEPNLIVSGECVRLRWDVSGEISEINVYRDATVIWAQAPISGQIDACPPGAGQYTYKLEAKGPGGNSVAQETVSVTEPTQPTPTAVPPTPTPAPNTPTAIPPTVTPTATAVPPNIANFVVSPSQIQAGDCVNLTWMVTGEVSNIIFAKNGNTVHETNTTSGTAPDCSNTEAGTITYTITAFSNTGQSDSANQVVTITAVQPTPEPTPEPPAIVGDWHLQTYWDGSNNMIQVIGETPLTAKFMADNRLVGFAGCNSFDATYEADNSNLTIEDITATRLSCPDPAIMAQETAYLAHLSTAATYVIVNDNELTIQDNTGQSLLTFSKPEVVPFGG